MYAFHLSQVFPKYLHIYQTAQPLERSVNKDFSKLFQHNIIWLYYRSNVLQYKNRISRPYIFKETQCFRLQFLQKRVILNIGV